ncbi:MAG: DUF3025 domain-containing protein [Dokdonella sp.]
MRFIAPGRDEVESNVFVVEPLRSFLQDYPALLRDPQWPSIADLQRASLDATAVDDITRPQFVEQEPALLGDGLHYEQRIASGRIATRPGNWHDLLNALIWLRYPRIKQALNARQVAEIAEVGPRQRSRAQCAMTHFDESGLIVLCADAELIAAWNDHDWPSLCHAHASAWEQRIAVCVFGHALLEHALLPATLLVGKAVLLRAPESVIAALGRRDADTLRDVDARVAVLIASAAVLNDPQELRPLPVCGLPGWRRGGSEAAFYQDAPCFRPVRPGRVYPPACLF